MSLVSLAAFKTYLREEKATVDDSVLQGALDAADLTLETQMSSQSRERRFTIASVTPTTRVFVPSLAGVLRITDCTSVASVTDYYSTVSAASTYRLEPVNAAADGLPYTQIQLRAGLWSPDYEVSVSATWGWAAVPLDVIEAARVLAKDIVGNRDVHQGIVTVTDAGAASARSNWFVSGVIARYSRPEACMIV